MKYPDPGKYQDALQFPSSVFSDPMLQDAEPETGSLGLPRALTGAFAVVFPVHSRGLRWAVKCFLTEVPDQRRRYRAIAAHLQQVRQPYTIEFEYQPEGIRIDGRAFPILRMEWVDGTPISRYVEEHLDHPQTLRALHENWRAMIRRLEKAGIAHGDLQHGNVLVDAGGDLRLVDYDTMYVPQLKGRKSAEVGHRNYQHPDRDESNFNSQLDRFSALVIDTALQACILRPDLWARFDTGENMLFRSSDFYDPRSSPIFEDLVVGFKRMSGHPGSDAASRMSSNAAGDRNATPSIELEAAIGADDALAMQAQVLRMACYGAPDDVPSLDEISEGLRHLLGEQSGDQLGDQSRGQLGDQSRGKLGDQLGDQPQGQFGGKLGGQSRGQFGDRLGDLAEFAAGRSGRRFDDRLPRWLIRRSRRRSLAGRRVEFERASRSALERWFAPVAAGLLSGLAITSMLLGLYLAASMSAILVATAGASLAWWQYRSLPVVRRRHRLEREEVYFSNVVSRLDADLSRLKADRATFLEEKGTKYERRLEELQEEALRDRLKHHFIAEAGELDGISHKTIVRLKVSGIRTAYQATPERVQPIVQLSGESKALVNMWRAALAARYDAEIPQNLSPAEERRVRRSIDLRTEELDDEIARTTNKIDLQNAEREQLRKRAKEMPHVGYVHYLMYLMRLKENRAVVRGRGFG